MTGWMITWMPRSCRDSSEVTESTRNGMSSVMISTTVCPLDQPVVSTVGVCTRTFAVPCGRAAASAACDSAAERMSLAAVPIRSSGAAWR